MQIVTKIPETSETKKKGKKTRIENERMWTGGNRSININVSENWVHVRVIAVNLAHQHTQSDLRYIERISLFAAALQDSSASISGTIASRIKCNLSSRFHQLVCGQTF